MLGLVFKREYLPITIGDLVVNRSGIITLLTDFGISDPYAAMMKGVILSINQNARIIDLSHQIEVGSIVHAAGFLRETFSYFPKGTVHISVVDPGVGSERRLLVMEAEEHFFVGPDNGIFWPIIEDFKSIRINQLVEVKFFLPHVTHTFHGRDVFSPVAAHISLGEDPDQMGPHIDDPVVLDYPLPRIINDVLYGQITRVDHFGNLITNIYHKDLERFLKTSKPSIKAENFTFKTLNLTYSEVDEGEPLALINSSGQLEIAVNLGRASQYIKSSSGEIVGTQVKVSRIE